MANLAIVLTVVILFQLVFAFFQAQHYQRFMASLIRKYQGTRDYQLVSEVAKTAWFSNVVALIFDKDKTIVEAYYLRGVTIFSAFKPYPQLVGRRLDERLLASVAEAKQDGRTKAVRALIEKYK